MANSAGQTLSQVPLNGPDIKWYTALTTAVNNASAYASTTAQRPPKASIGFSLFDTTLGKPIWLKSVNPSVWVDATGAVV